MYVNNNYLVIYSYFRPTKKALTLAYLIKLFKIYIT